MFRVRFLFQGVCLHLCRLAGAWCSRAGKSEHAHIRRAEGPSSCPWGSRLLLRVHPQSAWSSCPAVAREFLREPRSLLQGREATIKGEGAVPLPFVYMGLCSDQGASSCVSLPGPHLCHAEELCPGHRNRPRRSAVTCLVLNGS